MSNTVQKLVQLYSSLGHLSDDKILELSKVVESIKNKHKKNPKGIGQLAGLCKVKLLANLEQEIRQARKELTLSILSKQI